VWPFDVRSRLWVSSFHLAFLPLFSYTTQKVLKG